MIRITAELLKFKLVQGFPLYGLRLLFVGCLFSLCCGLVANSPPAMEDNKGKIFVGGLPQDCGVSNILDYNPI